MNILEALSKIKNGTHEGSVLVAKPPLTWGAEAIFVNLTDDYRVPAAISGSGYQYVMGVEDVLNLLEYLKQKKVSEKAIAEFVIHYANTDSAPSWIDDIPNI